jgi:single-strand DNA-binding protein
MNKVQLSGRLGKDPEVRYLPDGTMVVNVSMATSNDYKKKGDTEWTKKPASWHNLVAFGDVATALADYSKGQKLQIDGKIVYKQWEDKDGNKRSSTEIQVWQIAGENVEVVKETPTDDDVPF